jgi:hypothetical protein
MRTEPEDSGRARERPVIVAGGGEQMRDENRARGIEGRGGSLSFIVSAEARQGSEIRASEGGALASNVN